MPDTKITALTAIGANPIIPSTFPIPMVDLTDTSMAASGTTKKVTVNQILGAGGTATLASATITGVLTAGTNSIIGTGSTQNAAANRGNLTIGGTSSAILNLSINGADTGYVIHDGANITFNNRTNGYVEFFANGLAQHRIAPLGVFSWYDGAGGTRMTLNSTGLGVGRTPSYRFQASSGTKATTASLATVAGITTTDADDFGIYFRLKTDATGANRYAAITSFDNGSGNGARDLVLQDLGGNVGVGVTPSAWQSTIYKVLEFSRGVSLSGQTDAASMELTCNAYIDSAFSWIYKTTAAATHYRQFAGAHQWHNAPSGTANDAITFTQAMTLDASGNLLVGTTTNGGNGVSIRPSTASPNAVLVGSDTSGGTAWQMYSTGTSSSRFYVTWAGTINAVNTTIAAISDARLKENVQDIDVGLGAILALKPRKFDWKAGKGKDIKGDRGFIAQEFEQVFPQLVDEWADPAPEGEAPYKSVRQDLIPVLVKAIQELTARVQTLEAK
jgi:hypothetical protein